MSKTLGLYAKAVAGALAAAGTATITALGDGHISTPEGITIASAGVLALGAVWAVPNTPAKVQKYGKAIAAAVLAGLGAVATAYVSGNTLNPADLISIGIAILGGLGLTFIVPNAAVSDDLVPVYAASEAVTDGSDLSGSEGEVVEDDVSEPHLVEDDEVEPIEEDFDGGDVEEADGEVVDSEGVK